MPQWPRQLHPQGVKNTGGRGRRPRVVSQIHFVNEVRAPIHGAAQGIVSNAGAAILAIGPQGVGTAWYPSQIQVATSSGATDLSTCILYRGFIDAKQQIGQTLQGGSDTLAFTHDMQPGDLIYAVWSNATPGDLATLAVEGEQAVLSA